MTKPKQLELEDYIKSATPRDYDFADVTTGELFTSRAHNHYEFNDGIPFAPPVDLPRPTLRQRVENLTRSQYDVLAKYVHDGSTDQEFEIPDDPDAPLTASEQNYVDILAEQLAEASPLPDDGMPRTTSLPPSSTSEVPQAAETGGAGGSAATPLAAQPQPAVPTR